MFGELADEAEAWYSTQARATYERLMLHARDCSSRAADPQVECFGTDYKILMDFALEELGVSVEDINLEELKQVLDGMSKATVTMPKNAVVAKICLGGVTKGEVDANKARIESTVKSELTKLDIDSTVTISGTGQHLGEDTCVRLEVGVPAEQVSSVIVRARDESINGVGGLVAQALTSRRRRGRSLLAATVSSAESSQAVTTSLKSGGGEPGSNQATVPDADELSVSSASSTMPSMLTAFVAFVACATLSQLMQQ